MGRVKGGSEKKRGRKGIIGEKERRVKSTVKRMAGKLVESDQNQQKSNKGKRERRGGKTVVAWWEGVNR